MGTQQPAILGRRACQNVGRVGIRGTAIDGAIDPHRMHDHHQFAGHGGDRFALAATFGQGQAPVAELVFALETVSKAEVAS